MTKILGVDLAGNNEEDIQVSYDDFVGEGKKFENPEDAVTSLAKKAVHADNHIKTIEDENRKLREQIIEAQSRASTTEEILAKLKERESDYNFEEEKSQEKFQSPSYSQEDIERLVEQRVQSLTSAEKQKSIMQKSFDALVGATGSSSNAKAALKAFIGESEERKNLVEKAGKTDPEVLVRLITGKSGPVSYSRNNGSESSNEAVNNYRPEITWTEAKRIRKDDPKYYRSHSFQKKLLDTVAACKKSGVDFYKT